MFDQYEYVFYATTVQMSLLGLLFLYHCVDLFAKKSFKFTGPVPLALRVFLYVVLVIVATGSFFYATIHDKNKPYNVWFILFFVVIFVNSLELLANKITDN
jgi:hypothetical protein